MPENTPGEAIIVLNSGRYLDLLNPDPGEIHISDIAHGLANTNRFNGHTDHPYSVAQHSLFCSHIVSERHALQALLHDATEAYMGDLVSPLKRVVPAFKEIEERLWAVIAERYGVPVELHEEVHWADWAAYVKERSLLLLSVGPSRDPDVHVFEGISAPLLPLSPPLPWDEVKQQFIDRFRYLYGG